MPDRPIRVVVTYRVCQHWRAHIFAKLNARPDIELAVFHGQSIPGTKCVNGENLQGFEHREHFSVRVPMTKTWAFQPNMLWSLRRFSPDVILAEGGSNFLTNFLVLAYSKLYQRPIIWWTLGELRGKEYRGPIARAYRRLVQFQERRCDVLLGYSAVAIDYFRRMGYPQDDCFAAVNCVDTYRVFRQIQSRTEEVKQLRERLGLGDRRVVLFVGALTEPKRVDRLLRAFAKIRQRFPDTALLIVGDGPTRPACESLASALHLGADVIFAGRVVENVSDYYELGHVFVLPGLGGLAISEAMAHGMPVICTIADGCEVDYVVEGETGYRLFSDNDAEVEPFLERSLTELLSDPVRLSRMSANARDRIERKHNVETYIQGIVDAIRHAKAKTRAVTS